MNIPNEWVEKAGKAMAPTYTGQEWRVLDRREAAQAALEAVLPDILEAVAREFQAEIDKQEPKTAWQKFRFYGSGPDSPTVWYMQGLAAAQRIVRNFGGK